MLGLLGIALALLAIIGGNYLEGGQLVELVNPPAAVIVFGGTLAAAIVQSPREDFRRALRLAVWAFRDKVRPNFAMGIDNLRDWCLLARKRGLVSLEAEAGRQSDPYVANGLQLLADGRTPEMIRAVMEVDLVAQEQRDLQAVRVIESMGGYAPTLGIIGAVLGLIQVMAHLTEPEALGKGIATAFVATIYGIGLANLVLIPTANKIKRLVQGRAQYHEMLMDGLLYIAQGHSPEVIRQRLNGYLEEGYAASKRT